MALSTRSLRIFSAVEVLREGQADIRFALAPLFQADLSKFDGEVFDPRKLSAEINAQYRLNISRDIVEEMIPVFVSLDWIKRIEVKEHAYIVTCPPDGQVIGDTSAFEGQAADLAKDFRGFIMDLSPLSQIELSDEQLIDSLVDWLISLDVLSEDDLRAVAQVDKIGKKLVYHVTQPDQVRADDIAYLCARYAQHIVKSKSDFASFLVELASVGLITEVVRDFHKPSTIIEKTDLIVYLDAPVALDYLGLSGTDAKDNIRSILDKVVAIGGAVRIFRLSVEEMQTSLTALLNRRPQDRDGATAEALRRNEVLEAFVRQVAMRPDPVLAEAGVAILDQSVDQFPNEHRFFERGALDEMYSQIGWVKDDVPRFHDAATAALTVRKRRGVRSGDVFEVKHVVVTRNPFFPSLARRISIAKAYINSQQVGPVIHQRQLATAVWLRAGLGKNDEAIPRRYILSACRRVLTLRKNIVERVRQVSESLSPEQAEQLELLLTQGRSTQVLMDKTLGADTVIDSSNIALLVDEMKKALVIDLKSEAEAEFRRLKRDTVRQRNELVKMIEEGEGSVANLENKIAAHTQTELVVIESLTRRVNRRARRRRIIMGILAIVVILIAELVSFVASDFEGLVWIASFMLVTTVAGVLFLKSSIEAHFLDPWFRRLDSELLWREASELGLDTEKVEQMASYRNGRFVLADNLP